MSVNTTTQNIEKPLPVKIGLPQILDRSFAFLFKQMPWLLLFGIICASPYLIPAFYEFLTHSENILPAEYYRAFRYIDSFVSSLLTSTMIIACSKWHTQSKVSWSNALNETAQQLHRIMGTNILFVAAVAAGTLLFVIPGIIIALNYACILQILLIERTKISEAFKRSTEMVKGNRWRIFGLLFAAYLLMFIVEFLIIFLLNFFASDDMPERTQLMLQAFVSPINYALIAFVTTYLYYDLREKREGLDLQMMANQIDVECGAAT